MKTSVLRYRRTIVVAVHLALVALSYITAYLLRFDGTIPSEHIRPLLLSLPWLVVIRGVTFALFRLYPGYGGT